MALSPFDAAGVSEDSLTPGSHYPNQPASSESSLTYWWGATLCPPHFQTGLEIPLRSAGAYTWSTTPWPKTAHTVENDTGFTIKEEEISGRQGTQGKRKWPLAYLSSGGQTSTV